MRLVVNMAARQKRQERTRLSRLSTPDEESKDDTTQRDRQTSDSSGSMVEIPPEGQVAPPRADSALSNDDWRHNRRPRRATVGYVKSSSIMTRPNRKEPSEKAHKPSHDNLRIDTTVGSQFGLCRYRDSAVSSEMIHSAPIKPQDAPSSRATSSGSDSSWNMVPSDHASKLTQRAADSTVVLFPRQGSSTRVRSSEEGSFEDLYPTLLMELRKVDKQTPPLHTRPWAAGDFTLLSAATSRDHTSEEFGEEHHSSQGALTPHTLASSRASSAAPNKAATAVQKAEEQERFAALIGRLHNSAHNMMGTHEHFLHDSQFPKVALPDAFDCPQLQKSPPATTKGLASYTGSGCTPKLNPEAPEFRHNFVLDKSPGHLPINQQHYQSSSGFVQHPETTISTAGHKSDSVAPKVPIDIFSHQSAHGLPSHGRFDNVGFPHPSLPMDDTSAPWQEDIKALRVCMQDIASKIEVLARATSPVKAEPPHWPGLHGYPSRFSAMQNQAQMSHLPLRPTSGSHPLPWTGRPPPGLTPKYFPPGAPMIPTLNHNLNQATPLVAWPHFAQQKRITPTQPLAKPQRVPQASSPTVPRPGLQCSNPPADSSHPPTLTKPAADNEHATSSAQKYTSEQVHQMFGPKPVRKPRGAPGPQQQQYEQYLEWKRTSDRQYAEQCRERQARRATREHLQQTANDSLMVCKY